MHLLGLFPFLLLTLTPLAQAIDIQLFSGLGCTDASLIYKNLGPRYCQQAPPQFYSSPEMSVGVFGVQPGMIVYVYNGTEGSGPCDYKNVKRTWTTSGPANFWQCWYSYRYAAFAWDYYDPNVSEMEREEMKCEGMKGPDLITLVDGTEIEVNGMADDERDELWEMAVNGLAKEDLPAKFLDFTQE